MFNVNVRDPNGSAVRISDNGEIAVGTLSYSEPHYVELTVDNDVYNVVKGLAGKRFIISGILIATSRNIVGEKAVHIYESTSSDSGTHDVDIISMDVIKNEKIYLPIINVATKNGNFINADAEDSQVSITIFGYYVNA